MKKDDEIMVSLRKRGVEAFDNMIHNEYEIYIYETYSPDSL